MPTRFPPLPLAEWQRTRDTLHGYTQLIGKIRRAQTPPQKHYWHASLHPTALGLTTTPIPSGGVAYDLLLDLTRHELRLHTSRGPATAVPLHGQSLRALRDQTLAALATAGLQTPDIDRDAFADDMPGVYDSTAVAAYWEALTAVALVFQAFRHGLRQETSPIQLWPHHFDLALSWFSGRLVPDQDPADPEYADEQMTFGFSTGDEGLPHPYFYATAYPHPDGWAGLPLPPGATWHDGGWTGALLPYAAVVEAPDGRALLAAFLRRVHETGAALMIP